MEYITNIKYPKSELENISIWWQTHQNYDINEYADYIEITERDKSNYIEERIRLLKYELSRTDYQAIKYAEGYITAEEYTSIKAQRQAWRDEINELETQL